ncbi:MAG: phosphoenolpyruvate carboxykinase (ATP) [Chitinophagales bacterium]|nr:phosphoenolpyruvate carboxykinase (ATP) [Chitinophagales bacterium]
MSVPTILFAPKNLLHAMNIGSVGQLHYQLSPDELTRQSVERGEGHLSEKGALVISTGKFTGRSPKDKFIVKDEITENTIDWNDINQPIEEKYFTGLYKKMLAYTEGKELWIRDAYACADPAYRLNIRIANEDPASNMFAYNMFLRPEKNELENFVPEWHILHLPSFNADPAEDGTRQGNFTLVSFKHKTILIGGSAYTGEIKKGIFSILNYVLPHEKNVLSMHCSANVGKDGDTAIFFGLSGTGKTTLSADPSRKLIGDDEHGWTDNTVFNFEGGCYAKTIDLDAEKEPDIFNAIRPGALVENVTFFEGTNKIDFASKAITENTRVSYPISFIDHAIHPSIGPVPKNIFLLTADAYGILPPVSKLTPEQAMYQFISGYTAKVAGTEEGVKEPKPAFSACFGAPFLPLHPARYAEMLGEKIRKHQVNVWMVNTGWTGGPYGVGSRIKLAYTRAIITAALEGKLDNVEYEPHEVFGMMMPRECPGVPSEVLNPQNTWSDRDEYTKKAKDLAAAFVKNFKKFESLTSAAILAAAPIAE